MPTQSKTISAVDKFLSRDFLNDFNWLKEATDDELDKWLSEMDPVPEFDIPPHKHQKICFAIANTTDGFLFFPNMGMGKTKLALDIFRQKRRSGASKSLLVMVPSITNIAGWCDEIKKHTPELNVACLQGGTNNIFQILEDSESYNCYLVCYSSLVHALSSKIRGYRGKKTLAIDFEKLGRFRELIDFDMLVLDESHKLKSRATLAYKVSLELAKMSDCTYALTGTPFNRSVEDLWSQFRVVDGGASLGKTPGIFYSSFMKTKFNPWTQYEYVLNPSREQDLIRAMAHSSIAFSDKDCIDLPDKTYTTVRIPSDKLVASDYYDEVLNHIRGIEDKNVANLKGSFVKLRQITSGFVKTDLGDGEGSRIIDFPENPKMDAALEILESVPQNSKCLVFYEFTHTGETLNAALTKKKIKSEWLWSGTKDKAKAVSKFQKNKSCRILIAQWRLGAVGLNLQNANYCMFLESPVSSIDRSQAEKRIHRMGQTQKVFYYDLVVDDTVDEQILAYLSEGKSLFEAIVRGEVKL